MWCVGALAPWLAQGAGQLRRQGGSTCHPARPVITTSAVVLTRPPVPCHTNPRNNRPRCAWFFSLPFVAVVSSPRLLPLPSPFFSPSSAAVVSSARFLPLPPPSPLPAAPLLVPPLCRRRLPAAATAGAQRHRRWDRRRCRPWTHGRRRPRWYVPPPAARSCASICPRRRTPCCTRACRWRSVRALPARVGAPALVEEGEGGNQQEKRRLQK